MEYIYIIRGIRGQPYKTKITSIIIISTSVAVFATDNSFDLDFQPYIKDKFKTLKTKTKTKVKRVIPHQSAVWKDTLTNQKRFQ